MYSEAKDIKDLIDKATKLVIVQADNPDADSLGSALALEQILGDLGKQPILYCGVDIPSYLRYMPGWDRTVKDLPPQFDASIIVDASTLTLLEKLTRSEQKGWLAAKPCVVLDHHGAVDNPIDFAEISLNDPKRSSTGELILVLAKGLNWPLSKSAQALLMNSILGDTQGLTNQLATSETYRLLADIIDSGVSRAELEEARRELSKMPQVIFRYKAQLIERTEFDDSGRIALVSVSQDEINNYSPLYNPAPLVQGDMLQTAGVEIAVVLKQYDDGKITGAIRANSSAPVADQLAEHFGGGGHHFASGFKLTGDQKLSQVKSDCIKTASQLLNQLKGKP